MPARGVIAHIDTPRRRDVRGLALHEPSALRQLLGQLERDDAAAVTGDNLPMIQEDADATATPPKPGSSPRVSPSRVRSPLSTVQREADEIRAAMRDRWERAAAGWDARNTAFQAATAAVARRLVDATLLRPGMLVLELAAGVGEAGFPAAAQVQPAAVCSAPTAPRRWWCARARARATELGLRNVEFRQIELAQIDLPANHVDAVICRWDSMLVVDRDAALGETRLVLTPGGRLALATWGAPERNAWVSVVMDALEACGTSLVRPAGAPGTFALAVPAEVRSLLERTGFADIRIEPFELRFPFADVESHWRSTLAVSPRR
jgi:ubiquinone/menaquinone biosynthesis C-methylase UbiE